MLIKLKKFNNTLFCVKANDCLQNQKAATQKFLAAQIFNKQ